MRRLWICSLVLAVAPHADAAEPKLSAEDILQRAIEVQKQHEDAGNEVKYDYDLVSVTEKLDKHGAVKKVEQHRYRSDHIEGVAYDRLVEKDGRGLTDKERKKERKREEKVSQEARQGRSEAQRCG